MFWRSRLLVKSAQWIAMTTWAAALKSQNLYTATTIKNGHHHLRAALVKLWASSSKETRVGTPWKNASSLLLLASFLSSSSEICWIEASIIWQFWADLSNPQLQLAENLHCQAADVQKPGSFVVLPLQCPVIMPAKKWLRFEWKFDTEFGYFLAFYMRKKKPQGPKTDKLCKYNELVFPAAVVLLSELPGAKYT